VFLQKGFRSSAVSKVLVDVDKYLHHRRKTVLGPKVALVLNNLCITLHIQS
jgi:hypothetical protein